MLEDRKFVCWFPGTNTEEMIKCQVWFAIPWESPLRRPGLVVCKYEIVVAVCHGRNPDLVCRVMFTASGLFYIEIDDKKTETKEDRLSLVKMVEMVFRSLDVCDLAESGHVLNYGFSRAGSAAVQNERDWRKLGLVRSILDPLAFQPTVDSPNAPDKKVKRGARLQGYEGCFWDEIVDVVNPTEKE